MENLKINGGTIIGLTVIDRVISNITLESMTFKDCTFKNITLNDVKFINCTTQNCTFEGCNVNRIITDNSTIIEKDKPMPLSSRPKYQELRPEYNMDDLERIKDRIKHCSLSSYSRY